MSDKTHYQPENVGMGFGRVLWCSGRHVDFAWTTSNTDEITCGNCRRKLVREALKAAA
jgi:hypothetical protein